MQLPTMPPCRAAHCPAPVVALALCAAGYWAQDWSRVDPHYGTEADLKQLVQKAQGAGETPTQWCSLQMPNRYALLQDSY